METKDSIRSLSRSAKHFFSGTMLSRVTGFLREVLMAAAFGAVPQVAAFWLAFRFANLLRRVLGEGALNVAFIPQFESLRNQDPKQAAYFFRDLNVGLISLLIAITGILELILAPIFIWGGFEPANREIILLTMLMLPALLFICLYGVNTSLLNCQKIFFVPSLAPSVLNILWIVGVLLLWNQELNVAMRYLSLIIVVAFGLQWLITLPYVLAYFKEHLTDLKKIKPNLKQLIILMRPLLLGMIGVCATQINTALDGVFARTADESGPAFLWYAIRLQQLPLGLLGIGLTGALLPPIARAVHNNDWDRYFSFLDYSLRRVFLFMIPMTAFLLVTHLSLVNMVYGRGEFSHEDTIMTAQCLWAYSWGILPMTTVLILASAFYAFKNYFIPTTLAIVAMVLNCALNSLFVFLFHWGAVSIAIATSLVAFVNCLALGFLLAKRNKMFINKQAAKNLLLLLSKVLVASLAAYYVTALLAEVVNETSRSMTTQILAFTIEAGSFIAVFSIGAYLLNITEFKNLSRRLIKT